MPWSIGFTPSFGRMADLWAHEGQQCVGATAWGLPGKRSNAVQVLPRGFDHLRRMAQLSGMSTSVSRMVRQPNSMEIFGNAVTTTTWQGMRHQCRRPLQSIVGG